VLAVTATGREAEDLVAALGSLLDPRPRALFPSWETLPHERLSPRLRHRRAQAGRAAPAGAPARDATLDGRSDVVVAPVRSLLSRSSRASATSSR
jgi:transcription-repair coupling factor (superfamily II helicase)